MPIGLVLAPNLWMPKQRPQHFCRSEIARRQAEKAEQNAAALLGGAEGL